MGSATTKSVLTTAKVETTEAITKENETNDAEDQTTTEIMAEILKYPTTTETMLMTEVTEITSTLSPESSQTTTELIREILTTMSPSEVIPTTNTVESTEGNTEDFGIQSTFTNTVIVEETTEIEAEMTSTFDNTS